MASFLAGYIAGMATVLLPAVLFIASEMWKARAAHKRDRDDETRYMPGGVTPPED